MSLLFATFGMSAADLTIQSIRLEDGGQVAIEYTSDPSQYYLLFRTEVLGQSGVPVGARLGQAGSDTLREAGSPGAVARFYRLRQVPRAEPLDTDLDGIPDVFELEHPSSLNPLNSADAAEDSDRDGKTNLEEFRTGGNPDVADNVRPAEVLETSPANGETGVSVNRETVVYFSRPLAAGTTLTTSQFYAGAGGRRLLARTEVSTDRRKASLFVLEPMPSGSRISVVLDATGVKDEQGVEVDPDGDGRPGGFGVFQFETFSAAAVSRTAVIGRVFASDPVPVPGNPGAFTNRPLENVTITVDGAEETLRTTTDAEGRFKLEPAPVGRFFVHIDGRTAVGSQWPNGAYYPFVGKAWEATAGVSNNLAGPTGEIFLPLIQAETLKPVSSTEATPVSFPPAVVAANPQLAGVALTVPPNALFSDDGRRGGRVGIAPVPPDRLPEALPAGLAFPLVITVQTDGAMNFDRPVPARFPNLPDPRTGRVLQPGEKSALWSFDHDKGVWEIVGPMTVSADGKFVESDPGVGIRQPGWHGSQPGTGAGGGPLGGPPPPCPGGNPRGTNCRQNPDFKPDDPANYNGCGPDGWDYLVPDNPNGLLFPCATFFDACKAHDIGYNTCGQPQRQTDDQFLQDMLAACQCLSGLKRTECEINARIYHKAVTGGGEGAWNDAQDKACKCDPPPDCGGAGGGGGPNPGGSWDTFRRAALARRSARAQAGTDLAGLIPQYGRHRYAVVNVATGQVEQRGRAGSAGIAFSQLILSPNTTYDIVLLQESTLNEGRIRVVTGASGSRLELPVIVIKDPVSWDRDADGLHDGSELVLGTNPLDPDSDDDGVNDGAEARQGSNPLGAQPAVTGVIASFDTAGDARDVAALNGYALVADGPAGLAVFSVDSAGSPVLLGQLPLPGGADRVAWDGGYAAVAGRRSGLVSVNLRDPAAPVAERTLLSGRDVTALAVAGNLVFAGMGEGELAAADLATGEVLARVNTDGPVHDVLVSGDRVYVATATALLVVSADLADFRVLGRFNGLSFIAEGLTGFRRLGVDGTRVYVTAYPGFDVFDVTNPASPQRVGTAREAGPNSVKQVLPNGVGLGVAAVGINPRLDGTHDVWLYDLKDPANTSRVLAQLPTPGVARSLAWFNGLVLVADGPAGLQVVACLPPDTAGQAPTLELQTDAAAGKAEEGQYLRVTARVTDDVQVRNVEFRVDGRVVVSDGNPPFEARLLMPNRVDGKTSVRIEAVAEDMGGNRTSSAPVDLELVADARVPRLLRTSPPANGGIASQRSVGVTFSEPVNVGTLGPANFFVLSPGPDGKFGTADDVVVRNGELSYEPTRNTARLTYPAPLALGQYEMVVRGVTDLAGNPVDGEIRVPFVSGQGLSAEYYDNLDFTALRVSRVDPVVDFDWGTGQPVPEVGGDQFSVRWRGRVIPRFSETYTFHTISDDGIRLWIGGELVIDQWYDHGATEHTGTVRLEAGQAYDVRLDFYENGGYAVARLLWSSPSQPKEVIPASQLQPYEDRQGPVLLAVEPLPSGRELRLRFSEPLDPASVGNPANYSIGSSPTAVEAQLSQDGRAVVVRFSPPLPEGTDFVMEVTGVRDASDNRNPVASGTRRAFTSLVRTPGFLRREVWFNVPGALVSDLTDSPRFQEPPDLVDFIPTFETPSNFAEAYGQRISGWIIPPATGDYVFYVASDDQSEVYLSTDADPANRRLICREPEWNSARVWTAGRVRDPVNPENRSAAIRLEAGRKYYVEVLHKETYGGDNLAVTWTYQGPPNAFLIEAEDFDFGGGQSKPAASVMPYRGGAYAGESAVAGVDVFDPGGNENPAYRAATQGMATVANGDTLRPGYVSTNNFKVGWWDNGDWANYTRNIPAGRYQTYARLSSGGGPIEASLDRVVSGVGTANQATEPLGVFRSPATGGYDNFTLVPLVNGDGNPVVVELSGATTLRFTKTGGNLDFNYLVLFPLPAGANPSPIVPSVSAPPNGSDPIGGAYLEVWQAGDGAGMIRRDVYQNIPASDVSNGGLLADLRAQARFPGQPDQVTFPAWLEAPTDVGDYYGQVLSGWLMPPVTGDYRFFIASGDQGEFWLSTDDDPARKVLICREPTWAPNPRDWITPNRRNPATPENRSEWIRLEAGRRYYFEAVNAESVGRDYLGVTWQGPGEVMPAGGFAPIPGHYLSLRPGGQPPRAMVTTPVTTVPEESALLLAVYADGLPPFQYQWLRNGEPIAGATGTTLRFNSIGFDSENGAEFALRVTTGGGSVTSAPVRLTVVRDTTPPTLVSVAGRSLNRLELTFSEPMDPVTAGQTNRYNVSGGLTVLGAAVSPDRTRVVLSTSDQAPDTEYTVTVDAGLTDDAPLRNPIAGPRTGSFRSWRVTRGFLNREVFLGIGGNDLASLRRAAAFPHFPDATGVVASLETPSNVADNYGVRMTGFLEAPETGDYVFYLAADDQGEFWLSTDENPANARLLAREENATSPRNWFPERGGNPGTVSDPVRLEAGRRYYLEALMKNGGRPEHLAVTWARLAPMNPAFVIEAEDFDFDGGQSKPEASVVPYFGGAYAGLSAVRGIDYNDPGNTESAVYRAADQGVGINAIAMDQGRGTLTRTNDYRVGWNDAGDWYNYTRTLPAGEFYVFARASSGGAAMKASLGRVTDGAGTTNQTVVELGRFDAPATGGWESFRSIPLLDTNGNWVRVNSPGPQTLRYTVLPGNIDLNYLMLVPTSEVQFPPPGVGGPLPPVNGFAPIGAEFLHGWGDPAAGGLRIDRQPADAAGRPGGRVPLEVVASGSTPPQLVRWFVNDQPQPGITSNRWNLVLDPAAPVGSQVAVRAEVSVPGASMVTRTATVRVVAADHPVLLASPTNQTVGFGQVARLSVTADGPGLAYQWFSGTPGTPGDPVAGATGPVFQTPPLRLAATYFVRVTGPGGSVDSWPAQVTLDERPGSLANPFTTVPNLTTYRGRTGEVFYARFVARADTGNLWGTDVYTDDSSPVRAAVHTGLARAGETVSVGIEILPGQAAYPGSTRNGVTSATWGAYLGSFRLVSPEPAGGTPVIVRQPADAVVGFGQVVRLAVEPVYLGGQNLTFQWFSLDLVFGTRVPVPGATAPLLISSPLMAPTSFQVVIQGSSGSVTSRVARVTLDNRPGSLSTPVANPINLAGYRNEDLDILYVQVRGTLAGSVWGTDVYTDDSTVGMAAVHAGLLEHGGYGVLQVVRLPGQSNYTGSTRNGVTSQSYPAFGWSYRLARPPALPLPGRP